MVPHDITALAAEVHRHRITLSYEALAEGLDADALITSIMASMPAPARPLHHAQEAV